MSFNGKKTPLQLNAESQYLNNTGFRINATGSHWHGVWSAGTPYTTPQAGSYSQGILTTGTVLFNLTRALPVFYDYTPSQLCVKVWRNLLRIGRPVEDSTINCPALGNARPPTFKTSYPGYGTFEQNKLTDNHYNIVSYSGLGLTESVYPPKKYPTTGVFSYVYNNWSSLVPTPGWPTTCLQNNFSSYQDEDHYYHPYSWITGWPGANEWQAKDDTPQRAYDPIGDADSYSAAYYPRPDLAPIQPWRSRDFNKIEFDEYFRFGFVATVARQAYYEFWSTNSTRRPNQYPEFTKAWQQQHAFMKQTNTNINSFSNTKTFLKGTYSNINDVTTSDFSGVNLAFKYFGTDMIFLGKSVDITQIHQFGMPSKLLLNIQKNNALTNALRMALLYSGLTINDLIDILQPTYTPSIAQEKKIYDALKLISGRDLSDIKVTLNCVTPGLETLADLIDPKKMFPSSYRSLTIPEYSLNANTSKFYDFIYNGDSVNTRIKNWGEYLEGILPADLAKACGAFMMTMNQIKNIRQMEWEKIAQAVANLEVTNKDLPLTNSTDGVPGNVALANQQLDLISLGSGEAGTYRFCDFYGAMSGKPYVEWYPKVAQLLQQLQTATLIDIYEQLWTKAETGIFTSDEIQDLIDQANAEIKDIQTKNPTKVEELNYWWNKIGNQMFIEQRAIPYAIPRNDNVYVGAGKNDIDSFIRAMDQYSIETQDYGAAVILEAVSDISDIGGQSAVASMREARNTNRIINSGGEVDNNVEDERICPIQVDVTVEGGSIIEISSKQVPGKYPIGQPPKVHIIQQGGVYGVAGEVETAVNISVDCKFVAAIADYPTIVNVQSGWISGLGTVSSAVVNGSNYEITVSGRCFETGAQYTFNSPRPQPGQSGSAVAVLDSLGQVERIDVIDGGQGYITPPMVLVDCPPSPPRVGGPSVPGSFAGSPYTGDDPVPPPLVTGTTISPPLNPPGAPVLPLNVPGPATPTTPNTIPTVGPTIIPGVPTTPGTTDLPETQIGPFGPYGPGGTYNPNGTTVPIDETITTYTGTPNDPGYTPDKAIQIVTECNCDCWQNQN